MQGTEIRDDYFRPNISLIHSERFQREDIYIQSRKIYLLHLLELEFC